jgi:hypothetical protein
MARVAVGGKAGHVTPARPPCRRPWLGGMPYCAVHYGDGRRMPDCVAELELKVLTLSTPIPLIYYRAFLLNIHISGSYLAQLVVT